MSEIVRVDSSALRAYAIPDAGSNFRMIARTDEVLVNFFPNGFSGWDDTGIGEV
ncbi:hypothetical protein PENANT_c009G04047 [Penicillium antarcticum]|uniref:Uncharacterized protein n=1 Tax=Penicillium antarcticum TaxID=416450 RepID=A0A1V6QA30_9EURO|nr:hypothetical protein PENANT_c009G04047 [Penicillium antarcticum]